MPKPTRQDFQLIGDQLFFMGEHVATFPETISPVVRYLALTTLLGEEGPDSVLCPNCGFEVEVSPAR